MPLSVYRLGLHLANRDVHRPVVHLYYCTAQFLLYFIVLISLRSINMLTTRYSNRVEREGTRNQARMHVHK